MVFSERIQGIQPHFRVLEIGPGATPHSRSDEFLELQYSSDAERIAQSGYEGILQTRKPVHYYNGSRFPFADQSFDYVICSHVLEHVADVSLFCSELCRVAPRGYLEFPLVYYDYLYNIELHCNLLYARGNSIYWMKKNQTPIQQLQSVTRFFQHTLSRRYDGFIKQLSSYFFQGFEWEGKLSAIEVSDVQELVHRDSLLNIPEHTQPKRRKYYGVQRLKKSVKVLLTGSY